MSHPVSHPVAWLELQSADWQPSPQPPPLLLMWKVFNQCDLPCLLQTPTLEVSVVNCLQFNNRPVERLSYLQQRCQKLTDSSFLNGRICCFSLSFTIVNEESWDSMPLFGQKKRFKDDALGSGKLAWSFFTRLLTLNEIKYLWKLL